VARIQQGRPARALRALTAAAVIVIAPALTDSAEAAVHPVDWHHYGYYTPNGRCVEIGQNLVFSGYYTGYRCHFAYTGHATGLPYYELEVATGWAT